MHFTEIFKDKENYRGLIIKKTELSDISAILDLYSEVSINISNYKERLNPDSEQSFKRKGGIFNVPDYKKLEKNIYDENSFIAIAKDSDNSIKALCFMSNNDPGFIEFEFPDFLKNKKISYSRELIVSNEYRKSDLGYALLFHCLNAVNHYGFTHTLVEIYNVISYTSDNKIIPSELLNNASRNLSLRIGGIHIGNIKEKTIALDGFSVTVKPIVMCFEHNVSLPILKSKAGDNL